MKFFEVFNPLVSVVSFLKIWKLALFLFFVLMLLDFIYPFVPLFLGSYQEPVKVFIMMLCILGIACK